MEQDLINEFAANNFMLDPEVTEQCVSLCRSFGLDPADLATHWELFYLNSRLEGGRVLGSQIENFRQYIQNEQRESFRRKQSDFHYYTKDDVDMLLQADSEDDEKDHHTPARPTKRAHEGSPMSMTSRMDVETVLKTPASISKPINLSSSKKHDSIESSPFSQRPSKCVTQIVLNKHLHPTFVNESSKVSRDDDVLMKPQPVERLDLHIIIQGPSPGSRFMYDRTEDRFNTLEARIKRFGDAISKQEGLSVNNNVALASQEQAFFIGMVCCDSEGHINDKSVLLQGSVEYSDGQRVRLDLSNLDQFSIFPGQILGVEGRNPSGHCLIVSRLVDSIACPLHSESPELHAYHRKRQLLDAGTPANTKPPSHLSMMIAAGPFTTSDNMSFEPLEELLNFAKKKRPNLLLLMGPFVDSEHPQVKQGSLNRMSSQIFSEEIKARIEEYCEELGSGAQVALIPSIRDAHHDFLFPQSPFDTVGFHDPDHQITCLGNPSLFSVNELVIGCCTVDVLRHLSSEEAAKVPIDATSDRMARLAAHILGQRSMYPLYPAATGVPLDLSLSSEVLHLRVLPDVLIIPSDLAPFVKTLSLPCVSGSGSMERKHGTAICINPGRLAKGVNAGTFADIFTSTSQEDMEHGLEERARVSVIRL